MPVPAEPGVRDVPAAVAGGAVPGEESPSSRHSLDPSSREAKARVQWGFSFLVDSDQAVLVNPSLLVN